MRKAMEKAGSPNGGGNVSNLRLTRNGKEGLEIRGKDYLFLFLYPSIQLCRSPPVSIGTSKTHFASQRHAFLSISFCIKEHRGADRIFSNFWLSAPQRRSLFQLQKVLTRSFTGAAFLDISSAISICHTFTYLSWRRFVFNIFWGTTCCKVPHVGNLTTIWLSNFLPLR